MSGIRHHDQSDSNELSPPLKRFCQLYVETGNAYKSARQAGFSESVAKDTKRCLFSTPGVIDYIRKLNDEIKRPTIASIAEIEERLTLIIRKQDEVEIAEFVPQDWWFRAVDTLNRMQGSYLERRPTEELPDRELKITHHIIGGSESGAEPTVVNSSVSDVL